MDQATLRMLNAINQPCGYERGPITDTPLREQRPESSLPPGASQMLREALTGERSTPLPADASRRLRAALTGARA